MGSRPMEKRKAKVRCNYGQLLSAHLARQQG
jgi:hypothetical protein